MATRPTSKAGQQKAGCCLVLCQFLSLTLSLYIYIYVYLSLSLWLSLSLSLSLSLPLSLCVCLCLFGSLGLSVYLSISIYLFVYLSHYMRICVAVYIDMKKHRHQPAYICKRRHRVHSTISRPPCLGFQISSSGRRIMS